MMFISKDLIGYIKNQVYNDRYSCFAMRFVSTDVFDILAMKFIPADLIGYTRNEIYNHGCKHGMFMTDQSGFPRFARKTHSCGN